MRRRLPFVLDAQEHHGVRLGERVLHVVRDAHAREGEKFFGNERRRTRERDFDAELGQAVNVRARDAGEEDVAEDGDFFPAQIAAEMFPQRERVEQRLRRMRVRAVSGVDDGNVEHL